MHHGWLWDRQTQKHIHRWCRIFEKFPGKEPNQQRRFFFLFFFFFFFKFVFSPTPTSFSIEKSGFRLARMQENCPKPSPPVESCAFLYPNFREGRPNHDRSIFHITSSRSGIYRLSSRIWPDHSDFLWRAITSAFQTARPTTEWIRILQDTGNQS